MIKEVGLDNYKINIEYYDLDKRVGFITLEETIDVINIIDVFVEEDYRQMGIASKMFNYIFNKYKNKNIKFMLEVRKNNIPAIKLYEKFGFKVIHERKNYYKDDDALIMEVKL